MLIALMMMLLAIPATVFADGNKIDCIKVNINNVEKGNTIKDISVNIPSGENYVFVSKKLLDKDENEIADENHKLKAGETYIVEVKLKANDGYEFNRFQTNFYNGTIEASGTNFVVASRSDYDCLADGSEFIFLVLFFYPWVL